LTNKLFPFSQSHIIDKWTQGDRANTSLSIEAPDILRRRLTRLSNPFASTDTEPLSGGYSSSAANCSDEYGRHPAEQKPVSAGQDIQIQVKKYRRPTACSEIRESF
ncbi:MAG: hypothetical protein LUC30_06170, partial [Clostridiales bacterium]|nr:hypothetical protein [Clostridiales bacterium]